MESPAGGRSPPTTSRCRCAAAIRSCAQFVGRVLQGHADHLARRAALRAQESRRRAARGAGAPHASTCERAPNESARFIRISPVCVAGCASLDDPVVRQAREHVASGRGEQALALLEKACAREPRAAEYRAEYSACATCDRAVARAGGGAARRTASPRRPPSSTAACRSTTRATRAPRAGLAQIETDARHRPISPNAEQAGEGRASTSRRRTCCARCSSRTRSNRDARRLQRLIEERTGEAGDRHAAAQDRDHAKPISLELRDVHAAHGVRHDRARHRHQLRVRHATCAPTSAPPSCCATPRVEELIRLVLATNQLEQKVLNETTVLVYPEHAAEAARVPGAGGEELLPRQRRRASRPRT